MPVRVYFFILLSLFFLNLQTNSFAQSREDYRSVLVLRSNEEFDAEIPSKNCLDYQGQLGCYAVIIKVPHELSVEYSREMVSSLPYSQRQYLSILSDENLYSIIIPQDGGEIIVKHKEDGDIIAHHLFPNNESGQISNFTVQFEEKRSIIETETNGIVLDSQSRNRSVDVQRSNREDLSSSNQENNFKKDEINKETVRKTGHILVKTDVEATIIVDGSEIPQGEERAFEPGIHRVDIQHPLGDKTKVVNVRENERTEIYETLKPSRGSAYALGFIFPGGGHIYKKQDRGWLYVIGVLAGGLVISRQYLKFNKTEESLDNALEYYNNAKSVDEARFARAEVENILQQRDEKFEYLTYAVIGTAALYGISILDNLFSRPEYGYRNESNKPEIRISPISATGSAFSPSIQLSYRW